MKDTLKKLAWMLAIWSVSVAILGIISYGIRLVLMPT